MVRCRCWWKKTIVNKKQKGEGAGGPHLKVRTRTVRVSKVSLSRAKTKKDRSKTWIDANDVHVSAQTSSLPPSLCLPLEYAYRPSCHTITLSPFHVEKQKQQFNLVS